MRRWLKWTVLAVALVAVLMASASWWAVRQTRQVPEFYTRLSNRLPEQTREAERQMRADVARLKDDAAHYGSWHAAFSDHEINAWLCEELPKSLPRLLASGARDPRVVIEEGKILAAARFENHRLDTVISCEVEVELTEQPNMLALRVGKLRAGALPLPLHRFLKGITRELARGGIDVQWDLTETGPVALLTIPSEHPGYVRTPVIVESIELVDGQLRLGGTTGKLARSTFQPRGPIHRFVSYRQDENRSRQTARAVSPDESSQHLR